MIKIIIIGVITVIISANLKAVNPQYSTYIGVMDCIIISVYGLSKISAVLTMINNMFRIMEGCDAYLKLIIKIAGLNYAGEFAAGICKDGGHQAIANQIGLVQRITILAISIPVLQKFIELIGTSL